MYRLAVAAALSALALGQDLTSENGFLDANVGIGADMRVRRQQVVSIGELQNTVDVLTSTVAAMQASSTMYSGAQDIISDIAADTVARTTSVVEAQAAMTGRLNNLQANYQTMTESIAAAGAAMDTMAASMAQSSAVAAAAIDDRVDDAMAQMSTVLAANNARTQSQMASMTASVSTAIASVTGSLSSVNTTIFRAISTRASAVKHVWVGGCSSWNNGGWSEDCLDRVRYNTAAPKFRKISNTRHQAIVTGFYRIVKFTITNTCNWAHHAAHVNGREIANTHGHGFYSHWKDQWNNWLFRADANMWFSTRAWAGCGHHATHPFGGHSRVEYIYEGLLA